MLRSERIEAGKKLLLASKLAREKEQTGLEHMLVQRAAA
jgi:hypothetical protein